MKTVCIIPARGGSVRIPGKNIKPFHGKPIIRYSIETALESRLFDEVIVSTDDQETYYTAISAGAACFRRMPDDGGRGTQDVAAEVLRSRHYEHVAIACVLYATAPMLTPRDLIRGRQAIEEPRWFYSYSVDPQGQDIGGFYWGWAYAFVAGLDLVEFGKRIEIPANRCCDINTPEDWDRAESMYDALRRANANG